MFGLRQEARWLLDGIIAKIKCLFGIHEVDAEYGPHSLYCGKRVLPRGWFLTEAKNGFWVVYDENYEPQVAKKNAQDALSEAIAFAKYLRKDQKLKLAC